MNKSIDETECEILYRDLCAICAGHGKEDPYGNGDYWVVDDCWGGVTQKIVVSSSRFLTPRLVKEISQCIKGTDLLGAQVIVALDMGCLGIQLPPMGIIIGSDGATEQWDLDEIRKCLGRDFYRESGQLLSFVAPSKRRDN